LPSELHLMTSLMVSTKMV
jgi:hypothetical protein